MDFLNAGAMKEALDAIVEEAEKLMTMDLPEEVERRVNLIRAIAEDKSDLRTEQETRE